MSAANTLQVIAAAADLITALSEASSKLQFVNGILQKAHSEGRDVTDAELDSVVGLDNAAKDRLQRAIDGPSPTPS